VVSSITLEPLQHVSITEQGRAARFAGVTLRSLGTASGEIEVRFYGPPAYPENAHLVLIGIPRGAIEYSGRPWFQIGNTLRHGIVEPAALAPNGARYGVCCFSESGIPLPVLMSTPAKYRLRLASGLFSIL
jgi:hypothetical protein